MACNQILVFSLLTRRLLMMPPSFLNFLIIFLYLTLIGKKHWGFGDKHYCSIRTILSHPVTYWLYDFDLCLTLLVLPGHQENRVSNDRHSFACCFT